jgi:hypothetical protein
MTSHVDGAQIQGRRGAGFDFIVATIDSNITGESMKALDNIVQK